MFNPEWARGLSMMEMMDDAFDLYYVLHWIKSHGEQMYRSLKNVLCKCNHAYLLTFNFIPILNFQLYLLTFDFIPIMNFQL